jgi:hypothetical protein
MKVDEGDIIESFLRALPRGIPPGWPEGNEAMTWENLPSALRKLRGYRATVAAVAAQKSPIAFLDHSMNRLQDKVDEFLNIQLLDNAILAANEIKKFPSRSNTQDQNSLREKLRCAARQVFLLTLLAGSKVPTRGELRLATFRTYAKERSATEAEARIKFKRLQQSYAKKRIKWDRVLIPIGLKDLPRSRSGPKKRGS